MSSPFADPPIFALPTLKEAIKANDPQAVSQWVERHGWDARLNKKSVDFSGKSPLGLAAACGADACARLLWSLASACPGAQDAAREGIEEALLKGKDKVAKFLLDSSGARQDPERFGMAWLTLAAMGGSVACFDLMLAEDLDGPLKVSGPRAVTPLMATCAGASMEMLRRVLPLSDPAALDGEGRDALMFAADCYWEEGMRMILPHSDPRRVDHQGMTALMIAALVPSPQCVAMLLLESDLSAKTHEGLDALDLVGKAALRSGDEGRALYAEVAGMIRAAREALAIASSCEPGPRAMPSRRI